MLKNNHNLIEIQIRFWRAVSYRFASQPTSQQQTKKKENGG